MSEQAAVDAVDLSKINLTALNAALKDAGIKVTAKTAVPQRVELLQKHELDQCPDDEKLPEEKRKLGQCTVCNGWSLLSRPGCPFCGTAEDQPAATAPLADPPPRSGKEAAAKKAKEAKPEPSKADVVLAKAKEAGKITKKNVTEIEGIERRIKGLIADSFEGHWTVGRELASVFKGGQWKYRVDEAGKPKFKAFGDWVQETFGFTPQHARTLIAVSETYSAKQVREIGVTKLNLTLRLPEEARTEVLEKAGAGASKSEVAAEVQRLAPGGARPSVASGAGSTARPAVAASNAKRSRSEAAKPSYVPKENEVTAVLALRRYEVPMFARVKSAETGDPVRAKNIASNPTAVLELQNGVRIIGKVVEADDGSGLVQIFEFERVSAAAETAAE